MESAAEREGVIVDFSRKSGSVIAVTGETDFVTDGKRTATIGNGHQLMGRVTGTGCGASTAVACFAGAGIEPFRAACSGLAAYGIAGEIAGGEAGGPGTFVPLFLDALASLDGRMIGDILDMEIV